LFAPRIIENWGRVQGNMKMINDTLFLPLLSCHPFLGTGREHEWNSNLAIMYPKHVLLLPDYLLSPRVSDKEI
jgi:hypothetical protein